MHAVHVSAESRRGPSSRRPRTCGLTWCLPILCILAACGSDGGQDFALCGNGVVEQGEACDDGDTIDTDACTSACQDAVCGDGVVYADNEECDGFNLDGRTCASFDLGPGEILCDAGCQFDTSGCGLAFTPTPTFTRTTTTTPTPSATLTPPPTSTPTALPSGVATFTPRPTETLTPSPTPTPRPCGDGLLGPGETCENCPEDCFAQDCSASAQMVDIPVEFLSPTGTSPTSVTVSLSYRTDVVSIPGAGFAPTVRQRVIVPPPPPFLFTPNDLEYALRVVLSRTQGLSQGLLFTVRFDECQGSPPPTAADFSCAVEGCAGGGGTIAGCSCEAMAP